MTIHTFKKEERLTSKKTFDLLFSSGKSIVVSPFRLVWVEKTLPTPNSHLRTSVFAQLGISVPKKLFSKAVQRNRIKRRIREAYRKNKGLLYDVLQKKNLHIAWIVIYISQDELSYQEIEKKMIISLQKLKDKI